MGGPGSGRHRKVGRPKGSGKPKKRGRPRKVGRPKGVHTKWGHGKHSKFRTGRGRPQKHLSMREHYGIRRTKKYKKYVWDEHNQRYEYSS